MNVYGYEAQIELAEERWKKSAKRRKSREQALAKEADGAREWWDIDSKERLLRRLESKGLVGEARALAAWQPGDALAFDPYERILADNELVTATTLYEGAAVTRSVGRILIRAATGRVRGYGTGFLVSRRLLLTNNHVLDSAVAARPSTVEFFYWEDLSGRRGRTVEFALDPESFFETDGTLDFALVAVAPRSGPHRLDRLGWSPFIERSGKTAVGEPVNIIQHPRGEPQRVVLRENRITDVLDDFLHYAADTQRGSSGSPVYNLDWELSALHHAGVPKRNEDGQIMLQGGVPWNHDPARTDDIQWKANEGVRISRIVMELRTRQTQWPASWRTLFEQCFEPRPPFDEVVPGIASALAAADGAGALPPPPPPVPPAGAGAADDHDADVSAPADGAGRRPVPNDIVDLLTQLLDHLRGDDAGDGDAEGSGFVEKIDRDYSNRRGYDAGFLGSGDFRVPLPSVSPAAAGGADGAELPYHHFTVLMNPERRIASVTAVNIHGRLLERIPRKQGQTRWVFDTRLPRDAQIGNDLYKYNPLDRGHLVRRLDPCWGRTRSLAQRGNDDTFHYTNSAPQHADFNEDDDTWAGLEDYFLDNLDDRNRKATLFTGPVFRDDDPLYESPAGEHARIPRQYWKVFVYRKSGRLAASAYILSQEDILRDDMGLEDFGDGLFRTFQTTVADIEDMTGLDFGVLRENDSMNADVDEGLLEAIGPHRRLRRISGLEAVTV